MSKPMPIPVMIVEDDQIIMDDILHLIDWEDAGFHVVASANNGKLGLALFQQYRPELVITDIQMPVMGGLICCGRSGHMIRWCRS